MRDACVETAHRLIALRGLEKLSLRDVARQLGVSHQAPYKHFPSRDHLLAEVMRRCFQRFTSALTARERFVDPVRDLRSLGRAYLSYAVGHPLEYRLMFNTPWPEAPQHPELVRDARLSFDVLCEALASIFGKHAGRDQLDLHALFVWSSMHGIASMLHSNAMDHLDLSEPVLASAVEHCMDMVEAALGSAAGS